MILEKLSFPPFILILFLTYSVTGQQFGPSFEDTFLESPQVTVTALDSLVVWQEQVLLHTDKDVLSPKEHLFFKAYVLTGPEQLRVSASKVLKLELLNEAGSLVDAQYHKIENGAVEGSIAVPKNAKSGKHYLRSYTRWMLNYGPENFATKEISVIGKKNNPAFLDSNEGNIEVFPEGGNIIAGLENKIAINLGGLATAPIPVLDESGEQVSLVQSFGDGVATFLLKPEADKKYSLQLGNGKREALPNIGQTGYAMQVNNLDAKKVVVKISVTEDLKKQDIYLRGKINGKNYFESKVDFEKSNSAEIDIPKGNLPNGILKLQLEDEFDQVWATRPLYVDNNQLQIKIDRQLGKDGNYLKIKVTDIEGIPVKTELSVGVGNNSLEKVGEDNYGIARNQRFLNDLLALTEQLPKDFALNNDVLLPDEIRYNFQNGLEFYGRAYDLDAVPLLNTKIQIVISGEGDAMAYEVTTNEEGLFKLSDLQIEGEAAMVFRRAAEDQRDKFVKVVPYQYETPPLRWRNNTDSKEGLNSKQFIPKGQVAGFKEGENMDRLITLEGVSLIGSKYKSSKTPSTYNIEPTHVIYQNPEKPKFMSELFMNIPGVAVGGGLDYPSLSISSSNNSLFGQSGPLWVIDGFIVGNSPGLNPGWGLSHIDIDRIEFLIRSPEASLWGARASQGVILIYTRNGSDETYLNRKKGQLTFEGYHYSLSFDEYQTQVDDRKKKFKNSTLYWNPSLTTDENGEAIIKIPETSENEGIKLEIKTITPEGKKGSLRTIL